MVVYVKKIQHRHLFSSYLFAEQMHLKCGSIDFVHWLFSRHCCSFSVSALQFFTCTYLLWWTSQIWGHISYRKGSFRSIEDVLCCLSCQSSWCKKASVVFSFVQPLWSFHLQFILLPQASIQGFILSVYSQNHCICRNISNSLHVSDCVLCVITVGSVFLHCSCVQTVDSD